MKGIFDTSSSEVLVMDYHSKRKLCLPSNCHAKKVEQ
jgi:hypothetical protein